MLEDNIKPYSCIFCPNKYDELEDLLHHVKLEHVGMSSELLEESTKSRETKKQLGDYIENTAKGVGFECCHCFEIFSSLDKLEQHGRKSHNVQFNPDFYKKLEELKKLERSDPPQCQKCNKKFIGLVITRMNNKVQNICFNCYENYYGANALLRLTIGTPDEMIIKMKEPLK